MTSVVADVDTGIDDALALLWLASLHRRGVLDLHVTTVAGNTTAATAARNSAEVLRLGGTPGGAVARGRWGDDSARGVVPRIPTDCTAADERGT